MSNGVIDCLLTASDVPDSPGCNYLESGCKRLESQFETYLVVALACAAVTDRIGAFGKRNLGNMLCLKRARN